jgi:hypothetical protein
VRFFAIDVLRIRGGRIVEDWHLEDNLSSCPTITRSF